MRDLLDGPELLNVAAMHCLANLPTSVTAESLLRATPCARWDLRMLLEHMLDSAVALTELASAGGLVVTPPPAEPIQGTELLGRLREQMMVLVAAWDPATAAEMLCAVDDQLIWASTVAAVGAIEIAVHTWDLNQACGLDRPLPPRLARDLLDIAPRLVCHPFRGPQFAEPVEIRRTPSDSDLLLAFLGRETRHPVQGDSSARPRA